MPFMMIEMADKRMSQQLTLICGNMDWKKHGWLWSISMFIPGNVHFSLDILDWILEAIFSLSDTGYFQWDRHIICSIKPKCDNWLSLNLQVDIWELTIISLFKPQHCMKIFCWLFDVNKPEVILFDLKKSIS